MAENNRPYGKSDGKGRGFRPTGKSKGKFGKGKGKGKGKFRKGYGKSWNPKGKGKSGNYFLDSRYDTQIRHAREGLAIGGRLVHSAVLNARSASVGHANTEYYDLDSEPLSESRRNVKKKIVTFQSTISTSSSAKTAPKTDDILRSGREWTKGAVTSSTTTTAETQKTVKNLSFHTQVMCNTNVQTDAQELTEIFHSVRGLRRRGLTIDPGAANGLIGSETLRDLLDHWRNSDQVRAGLRWNYEKNSSVTGISGSSDTTLGEVTVPLPMLGGLEDACYTADVIGGSGSLCPALIGNPSLVKMKATIATAWFDNRDGLLIIPKTEAPGEHHTLRLLLTDTGHYLLPLDEEPDTRDVS